MSDFLYCAMHAIDDDDMKASEEQYPVSWNQSAMLSMFEVVIFREMGVLWKLHGNA